MLQLPSGLPPSFPRCGWCLPVLVSSHYFWSCSPKSPSPPTLQNHCSFSPRNWWPWSVAMSNICRRCFCSWAPLGFPLCPQHSLERGGWRGATASSPHPVPLCSSSWLQQDLAFNYKVLFSHLCLIINPFFAWHMPHWWEHCKNAYLGSLGRCAWCCRVEGSLAETRPHLPSSCFPFCPLFGATGFVQKLGFLWAQLFPSCSHPLPWGAQFQCLAAVSLTGPLHGNNSGSVCLVIKVKG